MTTIHTSSPGPARPVAAASAARSAPAGSAAGSPFPSPAALALARAPRRELERELQRGATPEIEELVGWEFRGINTTPEGTPPLARLAGIQKFVKGMFRAGDGRVMGYNCPVVQNALDGRWHTRPSDEAPRRFGFYEVAPVDPTSRDNHYLHALLLDYGKGGNRPWDVTRGLRDYLVEVDRSPGLWLGKAYYAVGTARLAVGYFVLERLRRAAAAPAPG
jgi:hypothetical protein